MKQNYNDLAIILAWPDATIRGDEKWMMFFRKIGFVKNLNFKIGHTGIILVDSNTQALYYYDFGRYISPRGLGRARSPFSDPRLRIRTKAIINEKNEIENLEEIAWELEEMQAATQGEGRLFFSVATDLNFFKAKDFADQIVEQGSNPYGAFARGNNNCSRFITRLLVHASKKYHFFHGLRLPESIKSSPLSNVVNTQPDRMILEFTPKTGLQRIRMSRVRSFFFTINQLRDNFYSKTSALLPDDRIVRSMYAPPLPEGLPEDAQWLGGVGEGAWYVVSDSGAPNHVEVARYTEHGELEYHLPFMTDEPLDPDLPLKIEYDSHMLFTTVSQKNTRLKLFAINNENSQIRSIHETGAVEELDMVADEIASQAASR